MAGGRRGIGLRQGLHPSNQAFSKWVKEHGFDDIDNRVRSDAMWLAQNWSSSNGWNTESHPTRIRESHREAEVSAPQPAVDSLRPSPGSLCRQGP
jgi:hypothetical protein